MRRNYRIEAIQIIMAVAIIVLSVVLFFKSRELSLLFPVVFGLASLLCLIYAVEGIWFNKSRVTRKSRVVVFILLAVILAAICFLSARTVLG